MFPFILPMNFDALVSKDAYPVAASTGLSFASAPVRLRFASSRSTSDRCAGECIIRSFLEAANDPRTQGSLPSASEKVAKENMSSRPLPSSASGPHASRQRKFSAERTVPRQRRLVGISQMARSGPLRAAAIATAGGAAILWHLARVPSRSGSYAGGSAHRRRDLRVLAAASLVVTVHGPTCSLARGTACGDVDSTSIRPTREECRRLDEV
eukprot:Amastigsp_a511359_54.p2 type:complete len:211 gc:universal Amastigsp_a511359_54:1836-1204(-)